jgi:hypothetical protein
MNDTITEYLTDIDSQYQTGTATEHTHRPVLQRLLTEMMPELGVTNEPKRIECGAPDFIITDNGIPVGYIETKDIGINLEGKGNKQNKEQLARYKESLENLIVTDYLVFKWYLYGELVKEVAIGKQVNLAGTPGKTIVADASKFDEFRELIQAFSISRCAGIASTEQLSKILAPKARLLASNIETTL